jgi:hypothetical protein
MDKPLFLSTSTPTSRHFVRKGSEYHELFISIENYPDRASDKSLDLKYDWDRV